MKVELPAITCPKCNGQGTIPMTAEQADTLAVVRKLKRATVEQVVKQLDPGGLFHPTAFNNRLTQLEQQGLLGRVRQSRHWVYFISENRKS